MKKFFNFFFTTILIIIALYCCCVGAFVTGGQIYEIIIKNK